MGRSGGRTQDAQFRRPRPARQSIPDCAEPKRTGKHRPAEERTMEERMERQARNSFNDANSCGGSFFLQVGIFTD